MALLLILLLAGFYFDLEILFKISIAVTIILMVVPVFIKPFAWFWFTIVNVLSTFVPKIVLCLIYAFILVPVGMIRKLAGKDTLLLKQFKKDQTSVFKIREHAYTKKDIQNPY